MPCVQSLRLTLSPRALTPRACTCLLAVPSLQRCRTPCAPAWPAPAALTRQTRRVARSSRAWSWRLSRPASRPTAAAGPQSRHCCRTTRTSAAGTAGVEVQLPNPQLCAGVRCGAVLCCTEGGRERPVQRLCSDPHQRLPVAAGRGGGCPQLQQGRQGACMCSTRGPPLLAGWMGRRCKGAGSRHKRQQALCWSCLGDDFSDSVFVDSVTDKRPRVCECVSVFVCQDQFWHFKGFARWLSWCAEVSHSASVIRTRRYGHRQRRHVSLQARFGCAPTAAVSGKQRATSATSKQGALAGRLMMPCRARYYLGAFDWL